MPTTKTIRLIRRHNKLPAGLSALAYAAYAIRLELGAKVEPDAFAADCLRMRAEATRNLADDAREG
jgi:hypothetical protein